MNIENLNHYTKEITYQNNDYNFYAYLSNNPKMALQELLGDYVSDTKVAIDKINVCLKNIWILDNIFISESLRGYGVGKNLMEMFFNSAASESNNIFLVADLTIKNKFPLVNFYKGFGFEIIHSYDGYAFMHKEIKKGA